MSSTYSSTSYLTRNAVPRRRSNNQQQQQQQNSQLSSTTAQQYVGLKQHGTSPELLSSTTMTAVDVDENDDGKTTSTTSSFIHPMNGTATVAAVTGSSAVCTGGVAAIATPTTVMIPSGRLVRRFLSHQRWGMLQRTISNQTNNCNNHTAISSFNNIDTDNDKYRHRQFNKRIKSDCVTMIPITWIFGIGLLVIGICSLILVYRNMYIHSYSNNNFDSLVGDDETVVTAITTRSSVRRNDTPDLSIADTSAIHPIHHLISKTPWTGTLTKARSDILTSNTNANEDVPTKNQKQEKVPPLLLEWKNDANVVHVIQTRFMQNQPNLIELGQARIRLFTAVTIPSIRYQTQQQFVWIIRTDPQLHTSILQPLIDAIALLPNAILVASNRNPEGFRDDECISDITLETVLVGSMDYIQSYHQAGQTHTVLETRCDADDAMAIDFVELIQTTATSGLYPLQGNGWIVYCADNHMEWQFDNPWAATTTETIEPPSNSTAKSSSSSSIGNNSNDDTDDAANNKDRGALLVLRSGHCVTPGLTWGYSINATRQDIPVSQHHKIQKSIKPCGTRYHHSLPLQTKCLIKLGGDFPLALRARTPTSAGMDHVFVANQTEHTFPMEQLQQSKAKTLQHELWNVLFVLFGVNHDDLYHVRMYISEHLISISRDALAGQCTKGHSCKHSSKELLQKLINQS